MQRESITYRQAGCILALFIFGSTFVFNVGVEVGQDMWISLIAALAMTIPAIVMYARIVKLFPGKNLFEILEGLFGKIAGKLLSGLYIWYALHLACSILRNFTDFIQITALVETPQIAVAILVLAVIVYLTRCGMEVYGKWSTVVIVIICAIIAFNMLLSISSIKVPNLLPILDHDLSAMLTASYRQFSLPFGEVALFLGLANSLRREDSPYKAYLYGILFAGGVTLMVVIRNIMVLGPAMLESVSYPSYVTGKIINTSDFFARIESLIAMNYLFAGIIKISLCIFVASKGVASLFNTSSYKNMIIPVCLLCMVFSLTFYKSATDLFDFVKIYYPIYVAPFQLVIPFAVWITAEIKGARKQKAQSKPA